MKTRVNSPLEFFLGDELFIKCKPLCELCGADIFL